MKDKKIYVNPSVPKVELQTERIIAASGEGGAYIPDVGWGSSHRRIFSNVASDIWDEDKSCVL